MARLEPIERAAFELKSVIPSAGHPLEGVAESIQLHGTKRTFNRWANQPGLRAAGQIDTPRTWDELTRLGKVARVITVPNAIVASQFGGPGAPKISDILSLDTTYSYVDVLRHRGFSERASAIGGTVMDVAFEPLAWISLFPITVGGKLAKAFTISERVGPAFKKTLKAIGAIGEESSGLQRLAQSHILDMGSELGRRVARAQALGMDLRFGMNYYEQAAKTQRTLVGLNIPFYSVKHGTLPLVPRKISMAAFGLVRSLREGFLKGAKYVPVPGKTHETLADLALATFMKTKDPLLKEIDVIFRGILRARDAAIVAKVVNPLKKAIDGIGSDKWAEIEHALEKKTAFDLIKSDMNPADLLKAGISGELAANKDVQKLLRTMRDSFKGILDSELEHGLKISQLEDDINYVLHLLSDEAREAMAKHVPSFGKLPREITTRHASMIRRNPGLRGKTLLEVNDLARKGELVIDGVKLPAIKEFFITDPAALITTRLWRGVRAITGASHLQTVGEVFGKRLADGPTAFLTTGLRALSIRRAELQAGKKSLRQRTLVLAKEIRDLEKASKQAVGAKGRQISVTMAEAEAKLRQAKTDALDLQMQLRRIPAAPKSAPKGYAETVELRKRLARVDAELTEDAIKASEKAIAEAVRKGSDQVALPAVTFKKFGLLEDMEKSLVSHDQALAAVAKEMEPLAAQIKGFADKRALSKAEAAAQGYALRSKAPYLKDYVFKDQNLLNELDRTMAPTQHVESMADWWKYYDALLATWKGTQLAFWPATHFRNWIDNMWRNYLAGMPPIYYLYARKALGHFDFSTESYTRSAARAWTNPRGEALTFGNLLDEMTQLGTLQQSARHQDVIAKSPMDEIQRIPLRQHLKNMLNPISDRRPLTEYFFDRARALYENPSRAAHYMWRRSSGDAPMEAHLSVAKYMFDYDELPQSLRVWKRGIPFLPWMYFNLPLQIEQLLSKPGRIATLAHVANGKIIPALLSKNDRELESRLLQDWVRDGAPLFMSRDPDNPDKYRYLMMDGYISTLDLIKLMDPRQYFFGMLSPILREPIQQIGNADFVFKKQLVTYAGILDTTLETDDWTFLPIPKRISHLLRNIRAFNEIDRIFDLMADKSTPEAKFWTAAQRLTLGGSYQEVSESKALGDLRFRLQRISLDGRQAYLRALRRDRHEEAWNIMQHYMGQMIRGY